MHQLWYRDRLGPDVRHRDRRIHRCLDRCSKCYQHPDQQEPTLERRHDRHRSCVRHLDRHDRHRCAPRLGVVLHYGQASCLGLDADRSDVDRLGVDRPDVVHQCVLRSLDLRHYVERGLLDAQNDPNARGVHPDDPDPVACP